MHTVRVVLRDIVPFAIVCSVLLVSPALWGEPPRYAITEIGPLAGDQAARAFGINNRGDVVGFSFTNLIFPDCCYIRGSAFLFRDGELIDLGSLNGLDTRAEAVNNDGQVAGWADAAFPRAFIWQDGEIEDIGTLGGDFSSALDINDAGQIVGWSFPDNEGERAFLWQNGTMLDLGSVPISAADSRQFAINNLGQVVGPGFIWEDGIRTTIAMRPYDINDLGQVVGFGVGGAVLWENGIFQSLGGSDAYAINNMGQVVGVADGAVLWHDGMMHALSDLVTRPPGWRLPVAWDINDAGQIVGTGDDGIGHAFLMTPLDADFDDDDDTDLADFTALEFCLRGPAILRSSECKLRDMDRDGHVDLKDFQALQWVFTGP